MAARVTMIVLYTLLVSTRNASTLVPMKIHAPLQLSAKWLDIKPFAHVQTVMLEVPRSAVDHVSIKRLSIMKSLGQMIFFISVGALNFYTFILCQ